MVIFFVVSSTKLFVKRRFSECSRAGFFNECKIATFHYKKKSREETTCFYEGCLISTLEHFFIDQRLFGTDLQTFRSQF